jgi:hypothetical protein
MKLRTILDERILLCKNQRGKGEHRFVTHRVHKQLRCRRIAPRISDRALVVNKAIAIIVYRIANSRFRNAICGRRHINGRRSHIITTANGAGGRIRTARRSGGERKNEEKRIQAMIFHHGLIPFWEIYKRLPTDPP